jgi:nicotinamidase-related amidase
MRIIKENAVGLLIDVQEKLFPVMHDKDLLEKNLGICLQGLQELDIPLLITQQYTQGLGNTISSLQEQIKNFSFYEKKAFSCCDEYDFLEELKKMKKRFVILMGVETHVCVLQTGIDLIKNGFLPVIIQDCVSSRKALDKEIAIERLKDEGAIISSYESILFELCRHTGTDQFKKISKLVK